MLNTEARQDATGPNSRSSMFQTKAQVCGVNTVNTAENQLPVLMQTVRVKAKGQSG